MAAAALRIVISARKKYLEKVTTTLLVYHALAMDGCLIAVLPSSYRKKLFGKSGV